VAQILILERPMTFVPFLAPNLDEFATRFEISSHLQIKRQAQEADGPRQFR
jgi:hypothetical protein